MNFRERLEQSREKPGNISEAALAEELEESFACEYFATDNIKSSPPCLDLRLPDGKHKALPYSYFIEIDFDSADNIEITTTNKKVKITGRDLGRLFDYLVAYRVRYIQVNIGADTEESGLFVGAILIEEI